MTRCYYNACLSIPQISDTLIKKKSAGIVLETPFLRTTNQAKPEVQHQTWKPIPWKIGIYLWLHRFIYIYLSPPGFLYLALNFNLNLRDSSTSRTKGQVNAFQSISVHTPYLYKNKMYKPRDKDKSNFYRKKNFGKKNLIFIQIIFSPYAHGSSAERKADRSRQRPKP